MAEKKTTVKKHKKTFKKLTHGKIFVHATFNNTIITITDLKGEVLCWSSSGNVGFKGSRKSTPYAASVAAKEAVKKAKTHGIKDVDIVVNGPGAGKESAVRSIKTEGVNILNIKDITPTPHNGCRPRKKRRV
ncbi:MAG: 30S ribosomal protein S11 [Candidatus Omnitrophica bacterium]|jgi:small subunit ribosomal protein S11|nr:30S ribosomal protein S11 [Candidatus Omnitrophota bacterium]MDD4012842.1 30S ribosomal protein S11 [Candidatus Omnitrophota bacterium]